MRLPPLPLPFRAKPWAIATSLTLLPTAQVAETVVKRALLATPHQAPTERAVFGILQSQPGVPTYRREMFFRSIRHVVLDEADMLMTGGFEKPVQHLLQLLRRWQPEGMLLTAVPSVPSEGKEEAPWGAAAVVAAAAEAEAAAAAAAAEVAGQAEEPEEGAR